MLLREWVRRIGACRRFEGGGWPGSRGPGSSDDTGFPKKGKNYVGGCAAILADQSRQAGQLPGGGAPGCRVPTDHARLPVRYRLTCRSNGGRTDARARRKAPQCPRRSSSRTKPEGGSAMEPGAPGSDVVGLLPARRGGLLIDGGYGNQHQNLGRHRRPSALGP